MAVNNKAASKVSADKSQEAVGVLVGASAPAIVRLQLRRIDRLQRVNGPTYVREAAYAFSPEVAQILLQETEENGMPVWGVYTEKTVDSEATVDRPALIDLSATFTEGGTASSGAVPAEGDKPKAIELASAEDMAELGLDKEDGSVVSV